MAAFSSVYAIPRLSSHRPQPLCSRRASVRSSLSRNNSNASISKQDNLFALACISLLRRALRPYVGHASSRSGYEGLVADCRALKRQYTAEEQREIVLKAITPFLLPPHGVNTFRKYFADRPGFNAAITPIFFSWLIGHSYPNESPEGGHGVRIEKCRFLEYAKCRGLCVNMCQQPMQKIFSETLNLPLRMTPCYEDGSCQMSFGIPPLAEYEDPSLQGPCLDECPMATAHAPSARNCTVSNSSNA